MGITRDQAFEEVGRLRVTAKGLHGILSEYSPLRDECRIDLETSGLLVVPRGEVDEVARLGKVTRLCAEAVEPEEAAEAEEIAEFRKEIAKLAEDLASVRDGGR